MSGGRFDSYASWATKDGDTMRVRASVRDKPTVADLLAFLSQEAPGIPLDAVHVSGGHIGWERQATDEERAERDEWQAQARLRHEEWERRTLRELYAKYGAPDEAAP